MTQLFTRSATAGACVAMVGVGGLLAAYGPAIPELKDKFGLSDAAAGSGLAVQSVGAVVGVLAAQPVLRRRGNQFAVASSLLLIVVGSCLIAGAPTWSLTLTGAVIAGLGLGGCDALITQLFLIGHGERGPALVNVAHACFGIGTVVAPAVIAGIGAENYRLVFAGVAVLGLGAAVTMRGLAPRPTPADAAQSASPTAAAKAPRLVVVGVVGGLLVLYIAHFAVQSSIGSWEPSRLLDLGHSATVGGLATSGYWLAMVIGRFAVAPIAHRVSPATVVIVSSVGMTVAVALAFYDPVTIWAYLLAGLFIGPIFPNGLNWLMTTGYAQGSTFAYVIAGAMAGAVFCPPLLGALIGVYGTGALAPTLLAGSLIAVAASVIVWIAARSTTESSTDSADSLEISYTSLREADL
ncbi:MFS transporter [Tsukamurella sp. M9C]|uniref:MFS transporter n=1 Tax=Tsukamurella sp. M9C TaxID=2877520 RepID=UPI001CC9A48E|nr:MFS transporter [Tsukamurella sp. M9C]MCA0156015.1 MFS transporter [Tsukamurella sp. M9C]